MEKNKIIVRILGGLGNQLFGYAAARGLALRNDAELIIDDVSGFEYDYLYQRHFQLDHFNIQCRKATKGERLEPFSRLRRYIKRKFNKSRNFYNRTYIQQEQIDFDSRLLSLQPKEKTYIEGYWQSEQYFHDQADQIKLDLSIIPPTDKKNIAMAQAITSTNAVALHFRFFDSTEITGSDNLSMDYYSRAILYIDELYPDSHYFVFSDRPDLVSDALKLSPSRLTSVFHNTGDEMAYADLWLMHLCNHFIIANSTFSWWGAWLGKNPDKIIVAPALVKRSGVSWWGFDGLLPESWIVI